MCVFARARVCVCVRARVCLCVYMIIRTCSVMQAHYHKQGVYIRKCSPDLQVSSNWVLLSPRDLVQAHCCIGVNEGTVIER